MIVYLPHWETLKDEIFIKFFKTAELSKLNEKEYKEYESSLNAYRDIKNSIDWAETKGVVKGKQEGFKEGLEKGMAKGIEKGIEKGLLKGMEKFAIEMIQNSELIDKIQKYTGLSIEQIEDLRKRVK